MGVKPDRLAAIVNELSRRPGHEKVRALVYELLVHGLEVPSTDIDFETPLPEVRGRTDALLGYTVFEFKRNLKEEMAAVEEKLPQYIADREKKTGQRFIGIATDGANFLPYRLRAGKLDALSPYKTSREKPQELVAWLDSVVALEAQLEPTPPLVRRELGRDSLAYQVARSQLTELWEEVRQHPDVAIKRKLWGRFLEIVYGSSVANEDDLFLQHTYLTVVAKTMATEVLGIPLPEPDQLLSGEPFEASGIYGAVESDFFDWVITASDGGGWVRRVGRQVSRFRLEDVQHDVLKGLYESLIDPEQRHDLGEYYTPDWMAAKMCDRLITKPLDQRIVDPACGSGTFLFHAVRRALDAAKAAGLSNGDALAVCTKKVLGVDIHPVAVIIARVTYLLAIGEDRLRGVRSTMGVPVYLGDSMQWNTETMLVQRSIRIDVPDGPSLRFPWSVAQDPSLFDMVLETMLEMGEHNLSGKAFRTLLDRRKIGDEQDRLVLVSTYESLAQLRKEDRNHIWGYVARNLARPIWLSSEGERPNVVVGNPPWLSYRYMSRDMQAAFRTECIRLGVWAGGKVATQQDLSGYFFARCAELYLRAGGTIGFVMPYAALNRKQFEGFRTGMFSANRGKSKEHLYASVRFEEAWAFDESVHPLFKVPSCVLIATAGSRGPIPQNVTAFSGVLPQRDASAGQAASALQSKAVPWPPSSDEEAESAYGEKFHDGATLYPRMLCVVDLVKAGRFGGDAAAPVVRSHVSGQEKKPWKELPRLEGAIESEFLMPLYLGETIAPYRVLGTALAVVPWSAARNGLMDAKLAGDSGYVDLGEWLARAEDLWTRYGRGRVSLIENWDHFGKLSAQMPPADLRVVYSKAGVWPAAAILRDPKGILDHKLYWLATDDEDEAHYLEAILNSETTRGLVAHLQSKGLWGARDFDKVMFQLPIPIFDADDPLHRQLAQSARHAEAVAAGVSLPKGHPFVAARQIIRRALAKDGIDATINGQVEQLLQARVKAVAS